MSIRNAESVVGEKKQMTLPKAGNRVAILTGIIDIGVQQNYFRGEKKKPRHEFIPVYTLVKDTYKDEEGKVHHIVVRPYPLGLMPGADKGKYKPWYTAHDPAHTVLDDKGRGDITKLIGTAVQLKVTHSDPDEDGIIYANADAGEVSSLPEDYPVADVPFEPVIFDLEEPSKALFDKLGTWTQDKIRANEGYAGSEAEAILEGKSAPDKTKDAPEEDADSPV